MAPDTLQHVQREATDLVDGLSIRLEPAPTVRRVMAYLVDLSIINLLLTAAALVLTIPLTVLAFGAAAVGALLHGRDGPPEDPFVLMLLIVSLILFLLALLCMYHGYFIWYESKKGHTPGKRIFGLRVVAEDGGKATVGQCVLRDMLRYVDCVLLVPGLICISLTERRQRLGDLAAKTRVVYAKREEEAHISLFMRYERYALLLSSQPTRPIARTVAREFLAHASRRLVFGEAAGSDGRPDSALIAAFESATQLQRPPGLDDAECLRFFAELCNRRLSVAAIGSPSI